MSVGEYCSCQSTNFIVFSSPCPLLVTSLLVLSHQQGQTLWKQHYNTAKRSHYTIWINTRQFVIVMSELPLPLSALAVSLILLPTPTSPPCPASSAPAQQQEAVMVIVLTPRRKHWPLLKVVVRGGTNSEIKRVHLHTKAFSKSIKKKDRCYILHANSGALLYSQH